MKSVLISEKKLSIDNCYSFIVNDASGGNCLFVGTVRNKNKGSDVTHLHFETYKEMALKKMDLIAEQCFEKFSIEKIAIHHREGHVGIKDIAVIIAVASKHRDDAFKACRYTIDTLKDIVPIWKKEHLEDGSYWVNSTP